MKIIDLHPEDRSAVRQAAALLVEGFREHMSLRISTRRLAPFHQDSRVVALERGIEDAFEALWSTRAAIVELAKPLPAREVGEKKPAPRRRRRKAVRADDVDTKGDE